MTTEINDAVQTMYLSILGRAADSAGLKYWVDHIVQGTATLDNTRASFVIQPEYTQIYGNLSTRELVTKLYQNIFEREPDSAGLEYWVQQLDVNGALTPDKLAATLVRAAQVNQADDAKVLQNKLTVANSFTSQTADKKTNTEFSNLAREVVDGVNALDGTVNAGNQKITDGLSSLEDIFIFKLNFETHQTGEYTLQQLLQDVGPENIGANAINLTGPAEVTTNTSGKALTVTLPKGELKQGLQFYKIFPDEKEVFVTYDIRLDNNFDYTAGTKFPGVGGNVPGQPNATGNREVITDGGFSFRFMMKENGELELYSYLPGKPEGPGTKEGLSVNGETLYLAKNTDYTISQHLKMNDPGQSNGLLEIFVNGQLALQKNDLLLSQSGDHQINRFFADIWNGGSSETFTPQNDSQITIDNIGISTVSATVF